MKDIEVNVNDVAASFQKSVIDVLADKTMKAALENNMSIICLSGGVARNSLLRDTLEKRALDKGLSIHFPEPDLCSDNAAMIASAGYYKYIKGEFSSFDLNAVSNLSL